MIEPRLPRYDWGLPVLAAEDLLNDGSFPGAEAGTRLVQAGERGEIVNVGTHTEFNLPVYLVEFSENRVVGCLEEEIVPAVP
jgi:nitrogen fixation protein NifZ